MTMDLKNPMLDPYNREKQLRPLVEKFREAIETGELPAAGSQIHQEIIELVGKIVKAQEPGTDEPEKHGDEHEINSIG